MRSTLPPPSSEKSGGTFKSFWMLLTIYGDKIFFFCGVLVLLLQAELLLTLLHWTSHLQLLEGFAAGRFSARAGRKNQDLAGVATRSGYGCASGTQI